MTGSPASQTSSEETQLRRLAEAREQIASEIGKVIIGQKEIVDLLLISLFARGHSLFVGVPGLAKTLLVSTLAEVLDLRFNRIQFTPDLMPADVTGTEILQEDPVERRRQFSFVKGPVFCNILLADEINRTPPKTQAALLQAMQERKVTVGGHNYELAAPFLVFATQNPIEHEGTYPLPEAQLDRFLFEIDVEYPSAAEEVRIAEHQAGGAMKQVRKILAPEEILQLQEFVCDLPIAPNVVEYAVRLVRRTRPQETEASEMVRKYLSWGAGPRASQHLVQAAKARAALHGRPSVGASDVKALAPAVLRHRMITNFHAEADGIRPAHLIDALLRDVSEV